MHSSDARYWMQPSYLTRNEPSEPDQCSLTAAALRCHRFMGPHHLASPALLAHATDPIGLPFGLLI